jgi:hypothetical protein
MVLDRNVTVVLPTKQYVKLKETCELRGEDVSGFVRRAVYAELARLGLLTPEEARALGVKQ